eukprot:COSAG04_NODE_2498_length_4007_cov_2.461361_1_plen_336_part_00
MGVRQTEALSAAPEPEPEPEDHNDPPSGPTAPRFQVLPMAERKFDIFINHAQASGQDQCKTLYHMLTAAGLKVWYDMQAQDLTAQGMEEGVSQSRNVLIFLSDGIMARPFCNAEQRWAKQYNCKLIGVVEKDTRHSPADFGKEKARAPADLKHLLDDVEFLDYERRDYKARGMVEEILRRAGAQRAQPEPEPELEPEPEPEPELSEGVPPQALDVFLGAAFPPLQAALDELGVEAVEDLLELEAEEVEQLTAKLKKVQARKFAKKMATLQRQRQARQRQVGADAGHAQLGGHQPPVDGCDRHIGTRTGTAAAGAAAAADGPARPGSSAGRQRSLG